MFRRILTHGMVSIPYIFSVVQMLTVDVQISSMIAHRQSHAYSAMSRPSIILYKTSLENALTFQA
jgi:hypothetical protein